MVNKNSLPQELPEIDISNIYIYVGDAVRNDYLADEIAAKGMHVRTIAASTHSPTSFASIVTGLYPPQHGVSSFSNQLSEETLRLFDFENTDTRFLNSIFKYATEEHGHEIDPIYSVLNSNIPDQNDPFTGIDTPFIVMERGPGGHAPYGDFDGGASDYFTQRSTSGTDQLRGDYQRSIELDAKLFLDRLEDLKELEIRDNTLVIYMSDHGELLGEGGMLGHNSPMRPELVYVPTVFIHPDLPTTTVHDSTFHHVDVFPTICDLLGIHEDHIPEVDGVSAANEMNESPRPCLWENQFLSEIGPFISGLLSYEGVWDSKGGRVFPTSDLHDRLAVFCGKLLKSSKRSYMRRQILPGLRSYTRGVSTYGQPSFDLETAKEVLQTCKQKGTDSREVSLSDDARSHLRDLGYME